VAKLLGPKPPDNHVNCLIQTLNVISEQQEAVFCRREFTEERIKFFSSRVS
jgi:hypothetical protein